MSRVTAIRDLNAEGYERHALHTGACAWPEKNCYVDIWIEVLHALRLDPVAMLGFTVAVDFEDDQWTFYKPSHADLWRLYGVDVQELTVWKPLIEHAREHLANGKLISTEADAFWLPDTAGTDYGRQHTKTTIVLADIDVEARRLGYFHNAAYYELHGSDFASLFRLDAAADPAFMPLYAELVRADRRRSLPPPELASIALELLIAHFRRRPAANPFERFGERVEADLPALKARGLDYYHQWAFGTIRQAGSAFELAAVHLDWLGKHRGLDLSSAQRAFQTISVECKSAILKIARAVNSGRDFPARPWCRTLADAWHQGMDNLHQQIERIGR